ncbi:MAG: YIP1 family protein [bacterium]
MNNHIPAWERTRDLGPLTGFFVTVRETLTRPRDFFEGLSAEGPWERVLGFWALTSLPPMAAAGVSAHRFVQRIPELAQVDPASVPFHVPWWVFTIAGPLLQFLGLLFGLALVHLVLRLLGGGEEGWTGSLRAAGYASSPALLGFIPVAGGLIGGLWAALLQYYALLRVHREHPGRLLLAYLLPVLLFAVVGTLVAAASLRFLAPRMEGMLPF